MVNGATRMMNFLKKNSLISPTFWTHNQDLNHKNSIKINLKVLPFLTLSTRCTKSKLEWASIYPKLWWNQFTHGLTMSLNDQTHIEFHLKNSCNSLITGLLFLLNEQDYSWTFYLSIYNNICPGDTSPFNQNFQENYIHLIHPKFKLYQRLFWSL